MISILREKQHMHEIFLLTVATDQESPMHALNLLYSRLGKSLPAIHAVRLLALKEAVRSVLKGAPVAITSMGRGLTGSAYLKHKIKRVDRLVGNSHLHHERRGIYGVVIGWLLQGIEQPLILIDWSDLNRDRSQQLLRASLPVGGRAQTLYEEVHPLRHLGNRHVQHQFLRTLRALMPPACCPIVIADSGFRVPFFREVERLGWHWVGRIRNRDYIAFDDKTNGWVSAKSLYAQARTKPRCLGSVLWVRKHPLAGHLVLLKHKAKGRIDKTLCGDRSRAHRSRKQARREIEPWLLVVSPSLGDYPAKTIVHYYRSRMQIEEGFRDTKSRRYGLGLADESRIKGERLANLLLIAMLASLVLWLIGTCIKNTDTAKHVQVNSIKDRTVYSTNFLARISLQCADVVITFAQIRRSIASIEAYLDELHTT